MPLSGDDRVVRRVVAKAAHRSPQRPPLRPAVGEHVEVGARDTEWPEFVFVTAADGSGWVPARHLSARSAAAVVLTPRHDRVAEDLISRWLWCRGPVGGEGWVPAMTVEDTS